MSKPSIDVYAQPYQDYNCEPRLQLMWNCHGKEFTLENIPLSASYYKCNEYGIIVWDSELNILHVAPMQHYHCANGIRYFLMHVYDNNLFNKIASAKTSELEVPQVSVKQLQPRHQI